MSLHGVIRQLVEQAVGSGGGGGLYGLHPGQSSSAFGAADHRLRAATAEQIADIPVPRGAFFWFAGYGKSRVFFSSWTRAAYEDMDSADEPATQQDEDEELLFEEEEDPSGWFVSKAASGRPFFWHRSSRRSLWHLPPGASTRKRKGRRRGPG